MTCGEWHPDDERLLMRYVDGGCADATLDEHLVRCRPCSTRMSALGCELERWHQRAEQVSDDVFDHARLAEQRRGIQQRLGAIVPARVLPFPAAVPAERHTPMVRVAAAVLLVALGGAGVFRVLGMQEAAPAQTAARATSGPAGAPVRLIRDLAPDAALEDIDMALLRPRTAELRALDEFTPHVRDLANSPR